MAPASLVPVFQTLLPCRSLQWFGRLGSEDLAKQATTWRVLPETQDLGPGLVML